MPFPPQHVLQWLRRECFGLEQPWARSNLYEITSILNVLIHQNTFKAGPKPINSTELETYRCQHMWIQLPTSEVKAFCVWLYLCSYTAHILNCLPKQKSCSQYLKAPSSPTSCFSQQALLVCTMRVSSSRAYLTGSTPAGLQAYLNYTASHAAKKPKPVLEPVKPPSATLFSEYEQAPMVQASTDSSWSTHFCVSQAHKRALCLHRMACKICSECCLPSHCKSKYKNRFSSSAGFPLPIFKLMQSLTFNHHCCYCSICVLLIHTLVSPQTEAVFALKSTALSFHLWI